MTSLLILMVILIGIIPLVALATAWNGLSNSTSTAWNEFSDRIKYYLKFSDSIKYS